jgi:hypothetical protein
MSRIWLVSITAIAIAFSFVNSAEAEDITTKKLLIKDNTNVAKRQVQVQSKDVGVTLAEADDPSLLGAAVHLYSATDDYCVILPAGPDWSTNGKKWKYKNRTTKNKAQVGDGKLRVKIKSGVTYSLIDNGVQGVVDTQVQFGAGTRYCMRCTGNKKDESTKFQAKDCAAVPCGAEPTICDSTVTTTTTTTSTTTTTLDPACPTGDFLDVASAPGAGGTYPDPTLSVSCTATDVIVTSNGIPHYTYIATTPHPLSAQSHVFTFTRTPTIAASTTDIPCLGTIGVSINGIPTYGPNEGPIPDPYGDPIANVTLHECMGHTGGNEDYHYHALLQKCLSVSGLVAEPWLNADPPSNVASSIVGYASDGFPVYGPYGCDDGVCTTVIEYLSSWDATGYESVDCTSSLDCSADYECALAMISGVRKLACVAKDYAWDNNAYSAKAGTEFLDECNGHVGPLGDYHYHATETFPYILGCFTGTPSADVMGGQCPPGP